jgi:LuxR family transcriptional regulator, quorum-sensing system regulator BjaR1
MANKSRHMSSALDFIDKVEEVDTESGMLDILFHEMSAYGFTSFIVSGLPPRNTSLADYTMLNGWPPDWFAQYSGKFYCDTDAIAIRARETVEPFFWNEVVPQITPGSAADKIMKEAREFGLHDGLLVPIFGLNGDQSVVSMAGQTIDCNAKSRGALYLMAMYAHNKISSLHARSRRKSKRIDRSVGLSVRERECLQWIASGKTDWETGEILSISLNTVSAHIRNATTKLQAVNRTQAVVKALLGRHINL